MKSILVPTDFSLNAQNSLRYAMAIAKRENAKIVLVHAYHPDAIYTLAAYSALVIEQELLRVQQMADMRLKEVCRYINANTDGSIACDHISVPGQPSACIKKTIKKIKPDLVVMGTKGTDSLSDSIFGSTTANAIGGSDSRVLAVPAKSKYKNIQRVAFAVDLDEGEPFILKKLGELRALFPAQISLIWIVTDISQTDLCRNRLKKFRLIVEKKFGPNDISCRLRIGDSVPDELFKLAKNRRYDLLSVITHKRSFLQALIHKSISREVAKKLKVPLLVLQGK